MAELLALTLFGRDLPSFGVVAAVVVLAIAFFLVNRSDGKTQATEATTGDAITCERCGSDFQPQKVELTDDGKVHQYRDNHCPDCGYKA